MIHHRLHLAAVGAIVVGSVMLGACATALQQGSSSALRTGEATSSQLNACRNEAAGRGGNFGSGEVRVVGSVHDQRGGASSVTWEIPGGAWGSCLVDANNNVVQFSVAPGSGGVDYGYGRSNGNGQDTRYPSSDETGTGQARPDALPLCQQQASRQLRVPESDVSVQSGGINRSGNSLVLWTTRQSDHGTCVVNAQNVIVGFWQR